MKYRTLSLIAIALWAITVIVLVTLFVRGQTTTSTDGRKAIVLTVQEHNNVLMEMRGMLQSVQGVVSGLAKDDMAAVAKSARASGMAAAGDASPALMAKLPLEFKQFAMSMHKGWDGLAQIAEQGASSDEILLRFDSQLSSCVACHAGFRLQSASVQHQ
jgi:hypothetical protein